MKPKLISNFKFQISNSVLSFFILYQSRFLDLLSSQFTHLLHGSVEDQLEDDCQSNWQVKYLTHILVELTNTVMEVTYDVLLLHLLLHPFIPETLSEFWGPRSVGFLFLGDYIIASDSHFLSYSSTFSTNPRIQRCSSCCFCSINILNPSPSQTF
ncbi:hypothetical protein HanRHA438_Chr05g0232351 [Helianthus annuus]|nr:hypothetical protein HanRHA438_Chr05g0232351 [Helianthus annuus]